MASIFTRIINREIPAYILAEDDKHISILDIQPLALGHALVIPKKEKDYLYDLEDAELADLMAFSKKVAIALKKAIECKRIGVAVIGLEVPHVHIHLVPLNTMQDINFTRPKMQVDKTQLEEIAGNIRRQIAPSLHP